MKDENQDKIAEQVEENSTPDIGKFGSVEELLKAYNALEKEFTKRCQLIKQLQAELDLSGAQAKEQIEAVSDTDCSDNGEVLPDSCSSVAPVAPVEPDGKLERSEREPTEGEIAAFAIKYVDAISGIPEIADEVLARYKRKLVCRGATALPVGTAVIMPAVRPRTLADAKRLADEMLG